MATWAQLRRNVVRLITEGDAPPYPGDWVNCTDLGTTPTVGQIRVGGTFEDPPVPFIPDKRAREIIKSIDKQKLLSTDIGKALATIIILLLKEDVT